MEGGREENVLIGCCGERRVLISTYGGRGSRVLIGCCRGFWRSNALIEIGFYHCLNEKALCETECVFVARRGGRVEGIHIVL